jgi:6-phosphogluconolactonase (cycloisomerase 2 family)
MKQFVLASLLCLLPQITTAQTPNTFVPTGSMSTARAEHTATLLTTGKVLIAGGGIQGAYLATAELYDPAVGTFASTGSMTAPRGRHATTLLADGRVLIAGGLNSTGNLTSAELYDPSSRTFSATGSLATGRSLHTATLLPNGQVLIAGGFGGSLAITASAELYDPVTGIFANTGDMQVPRYAHTATLLPNGKVLITGGASISGCCASVTEATAEIYDPTTGTFTLLGNGMNTSRAYHTATLLPNAKVLLDGGDQNVSFFGFAANTAEIFDPATNTFTPTGSMTTPRFLHTATLLSNGQVLVTGGDGNTVLVSASAELYDVASVSFLPTGNMATARERHTATLLPNGNVLVAGGANPSDGFLASAEVYSSSLVRPTFVYVNNNTAFGSNSVSAFSAGVNGALTPVLGSPFPTLGGFGNGGFIASNRITTVGTFLYAANAVNSNISVFSVNNTTAVLTLVPGSPFAVGGFGFGSTSLSLAGTPDGQFLYAAAAPGNIISAFRIGSNGVLTPVAGFPIPTGGQPDVIKVSPDGKFLAVALPPGGVAMFRIASDGTLMLVPGSPFSAGGVTTYLDINCASNLLFAAANPSPVSSPTLTTVSVFAIAPNGALSLVAGSPFTFRGGTGVNGVLSPDDQHLFIANLLSHTITSLNVGSGGNLTEVTGSPFAIPPAGNPFALATNQAGTFLYLLDETAVAGNAVIGFSITSSGGLSPLSNTASSPGLGVGGLTVFSPKTCGPVAPPPTIISVSPSSGIQGQTISNFTVTGSNFQPTSMLSFSGNPTDFTISYISRTATQIVTSVTIASSATPGARDVIITNSDGQPAVRSSAFTVQSLASQPAISVSPSPIIFLPTLLHKNVQECAKINNTGTAMLLIFSITAPSPFQLVGQPASIPAGGQGSFCVDFFATGPGLFAGNLVILSNAPTSPTIIPLQATVILPDLFITKIEPIQVVFEPDVNNDGVLDLVAKKRAAVLVSLRIDYFGALRDNDAVRLDMTFAGEATSRTLTTAQILSADPVFDKHQQGSSLVVEKIDLYVNPATAGNRVIVVSGKLVDSSGVDIPESTAGPKLMARNATVKETNSLVLAYVSILRCIRADACYGPFKSTPEENLETFTTRVARTISEGSKFIYGTYPVPDSSPSSPASAGKFSDGSSVSCPLGFDCVINVITDALSVFKLGKRLVPNADRVIGIVPSDYFSYHGIGAVGISTPLSGGVLVRRDHLTTAAHEVGHTFGLHRFLEEYTLNPPGNKARGFWANFATDRGIRVDNAICFMGDTPDECPSATGTCDASQFDNWIDDQDFQSLFQTLRATSDPPILLIDGMFRKDGSIELGKWYWLPEGKPTLPPPGRDVIQVRDFVDAVIGETSFDTDFLVHVDPIGVRETDVAPFALALPFPKSAATLTIQREGTVLLRVNLFTKLLQDAVELIPDLGFVQNPSERRKALHNKIDALDTILNRRDFNAARNKLVNDIRQKLQEWLLPDYPVASKLQLTRIEIVQLVDDLISRLP